MTLAEALAADPRLADMADRARAAPQDWDFIGLKAQLVARLGGETAHRVWSEFLDPLPPAVTPGRARHGHLSEMLCASGQSVQVYAPAQPVRYPGLRLPGGARAGACTSPGRALMIGALDTARTFGRSNLAEIPGHVFADMQGDEPVRYATNWALDPLITDRIDDEILWHVPRETAFEVDEAIDLTGVFAPGWGHCVLEFAPKLLLANGPGAIPWEVPVLMDADLPQSHYDLMDHLSGGLRPILRVPFRSAVAVRRLWAATAPEFWPPLRAPGQVFRADRSSINPEALAALLETAPPPPRAAGPARVFYGRDGHDARLDNVAQVQDRLRGAGFAIVQPEHFDFAAQLAQVWSATHVAGPWGSGLMLALLFGRPDLKVMIFHTPEFEERPGIIAIAEARGQEVLVVPGEVVKLNRGQPYNTRYRIRASDLELAMAEWL